MFFNCLWFFDAAFTSVLQRSPNHYSQTVQSEYLTYFSSAIKLSFICQFGGDTTVFTLCFFYLMFLHSLVSSEFILPWIGAFMIKWCRFCIAVFLCYVQFLQVLTQNQRGQMQILLFGVAAKRRVCWLVRLLRVQLYLWQTHIIFLVAL